MFMAFYKCREFSHKTSILDYERERETESGLFESVCVYKDLCLRFYVCVSVFMSSIVCVHVLSSNAKESVREREKDSERKQKIADLPCCWRTTNRHPRDRPAANLLRRCSYPARETHRPIRVHL